MILVDANYFLRWFLNDVPSQNEVVKKFLTQASTESIVVDRITLAEITYVLRSQGYNHRQIAQAIDEFCRQDLVKPLARQESRTLELFAATKLDFEDCWLAIRAHTAQVQLATFDKELSKTVHNLK